MEADIKFAISAGKHARSRICDWRAALVPARRCRRSGAMEAGNAKPQELRVWAIAKVRGRGALQAKAGQKRTNH